jgi:hypothetical protein
MILLFRFSILLLLVCMQFCDSTSSIFRLSVFYNSKESTCTPFQLEQLPMLEVASHCWKWWTSTQLFTRFQYWNQVNVQRTILLRALRWSSQKWSQWHRWILNWRALWTKSQLRIMPFPWKCSAERSNLFRRGRQYWMQERFEQGEILNTSKWPCICCFGGLGRGIWWCLLAIS